MMNISMRAGPPRLDIAKLVTAISSHQVPIIALVIKQVHAVSTDLYTCVRIDKGSSCAPVSPLYFTRGIASIPVNKIPVIALVMPPVKTIPADFITIVSIIGSSSLANPSWNNLTDLTASISI